MGLETSLLNFDHPNVSEDLFLGPLVLGVVGVLLLKTPPTKKSRTDDFLPLEVTELLSLHSPSVE